MNVGFRQIFRGFRLSWEFLDLLAQAFFPMISAKQPLLRLLLTNPALTENSKRLIT